MISYGADTAVITGGASGIGLALARQFGAAGASIVLIDLRGDELQDSTDKLRAEGLEVCCYAVDVTDVDAMEAVAQEMARDGQSPTILVNSAGVVLRGQQMAEISPSSWNWILSVNLFGAVNTVRAFLPAMLRSGRPGRVVNVASISGFYVGNRQTGAYSASKFALVAYSEALANDLEGTPVRVSIVAPSGVSTKFYETSASNRGAKGPDSGFDTTPEDTAQAMSPDEVARRVFHGLEGDELYIFTHPETRVRFAQRVEKIMAAYDRAESFDSAAGGD